MHYAYTNVSIILIEIGVLYRQQVATVHYLNSASVLLGQVPGGATPISKCPDVCVQDLKMYPF